MATATTRKANRRAVARRVLLGLFLAAAVGLAMWPEGRAFLGMASREVLVVYIREENSRGLATLPLPGREDLVSALDPTELRLLITGPPSRLPRGTRAVVLRETFVAGLLVESRAQYVRQFPVHVPGRLSGEGANTGVDPSCALLVVDLVVSTGSRGAGGEPASIRVEAPSLTGPGGPATVSAGVIGPGEEWLMAAIGSGEGKPAVLLPDDPDYEGQIRRAFYEGLPVSVVSVVNLGYWSSGKIEFRDRAGG